jgi:competence protein ComEA
MKKWLHNYFDISKGEFNGLMVLVLLIFVVSFLPAIYDWISPIPIDPGLEKEAEAHFKAQELAAKQPRTPVYLRAKHHVAIRPRTKTPVRLRNFDPNTTNLQGWQELGFSTKQAQVMINYRKKGGNFRKPEDLQKMYVVSPAAYQKLRPFIVIQTPPKAAAKQARDGQVFASQQAKALLPMPMVEVNAADSAGLTTIRGIGPAFAKRILQYRARVGGFHRKEQLMEVYGLDQLKFDEIKDQVWVDVTLIKRLNMNAVRLEDFKNNPYIRYKQAHAIIQYREQHGNYSNFDDLKKVIILTPEVLEQLSPYMSFVP